MRRLPAEGLLLVTVLLWSFNFTAARYGVTHGFSPLAFASLRWAIAGVALCAVAAVRGERFRLTRRELALLLGASALGVCLNQIAFANAVHLAPAATVALVFGTLPIFVALIAQATGTERAGARHWLATLVSFAGVALVSVGAASGVGGSLGGVLLALVTSVTFAGYAVAIVPLMVRNSPLVVTALSSLAGAVMLAIAAAPALAGERWSGVGGLAAGALGYSAIGSVVIGNALWLTAVDRLGPSRTALFSNLQPFVGALFAVLVLSERLRALEIVGGVVIAAGIAVGGRGVTERAARAPSPGPET